MFIIPFEHVLQTVLGYGTIVLEELVSVNQLLMILQIAFAIS